MKTITLNISTVVILALFGAGCASTDSATQSTAKSAQEEIATTVMMPISGMQFTLPRNWKLEKLDQKSGGMGKQDIAIINVPDPKYHVTIPMIVTEYGSAEPTEKPDAVTATGVKIYADACAPAISCYTVFYKGTSYGVHFSEPDSNEVAPENLDGVWFPSTTVTEKDTLNFLSTVK
jgi:hypothetical protein